MSLRFDHTNTTQIFPCSFWIERGDHLLIINDPIATNFLSSMPFLYGLHILMRNRDRKSTRLNSSHRCISYAVFCLKKKKKKENKYHEKNETNVNIATHIV